MRFWFSKEDKLENRKRDIHIIETKSYLENISEGKILVVEFHGKYGYGTKGNDDAEFMEDIASFLIKAYHPAGLVFDLRNLHYEWGNSIYSIFDVGKSEIKPDFPVVAVTSEFCKQPLTNLLNCFGGEAENFLFDNFEDAFAEIRKQIEV